MGIGRKSQYINYLAIDLLDRFGNAAPTQAQIDQMESLIAELTHNYPLSFDHQLDASEMRYLQFSAGNKISQESVRLLGIMSLGAWR